MCKNIAFTIQNVCNQKVDFTLQHRVAKPIVKLFFLILEHFQYETSLAEFSNDIDLLPLTFNMFVSLF